VGDVDPVINRVLNEEGQGHETRTLLYTRLKDLLGRPLVSFFTSFSQPVAIEDADADMLEGVLQKLDLSNGLALMISSPGGDGLAAERIVNVLRAYSGTNEYSAVVPGKAKSAATMVSFGASKVLMGATSELGPVDPQLTMVENQQTKRFSAHNVVKSYEDLFARAVNEKGNLQPYLQQLANYDAREIREMEAAIALSEDIAIRTLGTRMMKGLAETEIKKKIGVFLSSEATKTHGRPIYRDQATDAGLIIEHVDVTSDLWQAVYELYIRLNYYVTNKVSKVVESEAHSFAAGIPKGN